MGSRSLLLTHPLGAPFVTNAICAFNESDLLSRVITTINFSKSFIERVPSAAIQRELLRRSWIPQEVLPKCYFYPWREILRIFLEKFKLNSMLNISSKSLRDLLFLHFDLTTSKNNKHFEKIDTVYAYEDSSALTFERANKLGIARIYDLPIAYYKESQKIQKEEVELFPNFTSALEAANEPTWKIDRKQQELELASKIIVPSSFVKFSLENHGILDKQIKIVPFGAPSYFNVRVAPPSSFQVLFVGRIGPRKGVHYLLQAWSKLKLRDAKLKLVGICEFSDDYLASLPESVEIKQSVPHKELESIYHSASVLVLPSLVEGFALVMLEAMSCGVPVIATLNSGASDLITAGKDGFIVDIRSVQQLIEKMEWCYSNHEALHEMGKEAALKASQFSWENYRRKLNDFLVEANE